jgi:tripartite-type tricarboxylate transporter receptor subunit TctC
MRRAGISAIVALLATAAGAQSNYPTKTVRLIVPFAPGGGTSSVARLVGQKLSEAWRQQVLVDPRPGGNTVIGTEAMVKSPADGYTLLIVTSSHAINATLMKTPYDAVRDFAPVSTLSRSHYVLVVHPALPVKTLREFIGLARARPGQLDYAATGPANQLATELFSMQSGIKMQHIPYKGGGAAITDLLGGHVQVHVNVAVSLIGPIKSGKVKGLAVTGDNRLAALPEVPTFREAGLPAFTSSNWNGILVHAETPKPIVEKLAADIGRVLATPDMRDKLHAQGQSVWSSTPEQFAALIRSEIEVFAKVVKVAQIKVE